MNHTVAHSISTHSGAAIRGGVYGSPGLNSSQHAGTFRKITSMLKSKGHAITFQAPVGSKGAAFCWRFEAMARRMIPDWRAAALGLLGALEVVLPELRLRVV